MTIYKEEKENWNKGLHEVLKEKTREEQMGIIYAILTRIYKSPEYTILRNTFIDMTTVDDL